MICDGPDVRRIEPPDGLEAVLVVPAEAGARPRRRARRCPAEVPMADAVANIASAAKLTLGLATSDWELIAAGLRRPPAPALPGASVPALGGAARRARRELGALGATISGAGPTVLVWCRAEQTGPVMQALRAECEGWAQLLRAPFTADGLEVSSLG